jgi:hypothetical protein
MIAKNSKQLGNFRKSFFPRAAPGKVMLGVAFFSAFMTVVEFVSAVNKYFKPPSTVLSDSYRQDSIMIAAILAVIFFLLTAVMIALYYVHKKHRVDLYDDGVVIITWRGSTTFAWENIYDLKVVPIYGRSTKPINWEYTLTRDDDVKATFRGLEGVRTLGKYIEKKVS